ncbi:MAG: transcription antitermination factor NusB, partial [Gammaproteobacteria bacterium]
MRHFRDEVAETQNTVIDGHAFRGDGLDSLGKQLVRQTLIHYFEYTLAIDRLLAKPLPKKHRDLRCLLLVGMSAVDHLRQPEHTSVNAAVETASLLGKEWAKGLINGVLRTFIRQRHEIRSACQESETAALNHPKWLIRTVEEDWPDQADSIFKANLTPPPMTLRVNQLLISRDDYAGLLSEKGLDHELSLRAPGAISLKHAVPVRELPGFASGMVSVQDESAQLASLILAPTAQESILDACAAPGGKTGHLLELA